MIKIDKRKIENIKDYYCTNIRDSIINVINSKINSSKNKNILEEIRDNIDIFIKSEFPELFEYIKNDFPKINSFFLYDIYDYYSKLTLRNNFNGSNDKEKIKNKIEVINNIITKYNEKDLDINKLKTDREIKDELNTRKEKLDIIDLREELNNIFDYDKLMKDELRHCIITKLNLEICPYCNRQFISKYKDNKGNDKTTADLDHFYSKKKYPIFAFSIYNFIPSCKLCNSRTMKGEKNFFISPSIYPFEESFNDYAKFIIKFDNNYDVDVLKGSSDKFSIDFEFICNKVDENKVNNFIETFKLKELYSLNHNDYVKEIIKKLIIYNKSRIDELYQEYGGTLFKNKEEILQTIVSNYVESKDIDKRVLSKLTKDILEEFRIEYSV